MTRVFFTTDLHGSDLCFRKFLNAKKYYNADVIVVGGDVTGKMLIPIVEQPDGSYKTAFLKTEVTLKSKEEVDEFVKKIGSTGGYPFLTTPREMEQLSKDPAKVEQMFTKLIVQRIESWVQLADERLKDDKTKCFIQPGNDDQYEIDVALADAQRIVNTDGKVVEIDKHHEMIGLGNANITPWRCPRDKREEELETKILSMVFNVKDISNCIFDFHCPPYDSGLDVAPLLDKNLTPQLQAGGGFKLVPVGSTAVRNAIEKYQPLLGLHGHIHESKGSRKLGRTLCFNPGSEYGEGILRGTLIDLDGGKIKNYLFTQG